jgi:hypothetical protein
VGASYGVYKLDSDPPHWSYNGSWELQQMAIAYIALLNHLHKSVGAMFRQRLRRERSVEPGVRGDRTWLLRE